MSKCAVWLRRAVAVLVLAGFICIFAPIPWVYAKHLAWLAKLQFFPALAAGGALSLLTALAILALTVLFGRWYCAVLCPLGLMQDAFFALKPHRNQGGRSKAQKVTRYAALAIFLALDVAGLGVAWLEPYGLFGRIMTMPLIALTLGLAIFAFALWKGRVWCNWICPVGTILGMASRFAPFRLKIDSARCIGCKKCEKSCRASAIYIKGKGEGGDIDQSKCIQCRNCAAICPKNAIGAAIAQKSAPKAQKSENNAGSAGADGMTRRAFLAGAAASAAAFAVRAAEDKTVDGGFADVSAPGIDVRNASLKPAGSHSIANFQAKCVGCQLCVKSCPNHVLRPSMRFKDFGQPEMAFDKGFCTTDCTRCSQVCPAGAIDFVAPKAKKDIHIGSAIWHQDRCLAATEGVNCTACFRHCPVNAIKRVDNGAGALVPVVDAIACIGCGACEHVCPARPMPGMTVQAFARHREYAPVDAGEVLDEAISLIEKQGKSCVIVKDGVIAAVNEGRGIKPLLELVDRDKSKLEGATVVDKVIGRAAASICIVAKVKRVCALMASNDAIALLAKHGIECEARERVEMILNRARTGSCPMEAACANLDDPAAMVAALRAAIR